MSGEGERSNYVRGWGDREETTGEGSGEWERHVCRRCIVGDSRPRPCPCDQTNSRLVTSREEMGGGKEVRRMSDSECRDE